MSSEKDFEIIPLDSADPRHYGITCFFKNEGHTFGNVLVHYLEKNSHVGHSGYSIPHPSESKMFLRIQTVDTLPEKAFQTALVQIQNSSHQFIQSFDKAIQDFMGRQMDLE
ncbi:DNA-directed RNA polymerases I and III subunit RPAC2 [Thelohanellus kitauei]|uniref:DNA-directed RNA polymerases I and III subunit RPAC2 n=1 Tax=Thelohanellus kitauei TaxID=669202 RepID=A0A0C2IKE2_THEKT|nr:DNA-directed RNA polymerases I and III subunit RPAC2 [Thelohanellus kitauei]